MPHVRRFQHARLQALIDWSRIEAGDLFRLAGLYKQNDMHKEAEEMYVRALRGCEKTVGTDHWRTRTIARNLHNLHNLGCCARIRL